YSTRRRRLAVTNNRGSGARWAGTRSSSTPRPRACGLRSTEDRMLVDYQAEAGIAQLTLANPPANTYSCEVMQKLDAAGLRARMDDSVDVILVRGSGDKFFCAGADVALLATMTPRYKYNFCLHANETLLRLENTPKLVVGALGGHCVGGGLEIAMAADVRI